MSRIWKVWAFGVLALFSFAPVAWAKGHVVVVPYGYSWYGPRWWGPGWYGAWGPYGPYGRYPIAGANTGNVKIKTETKGDLIYVDGGYAGLTGKLKKFPLRPGVHTIEIRDPHGRTHYQERVEVILGKTVEIRPDYRG